MISVFAPRSRGGVDEVLDVPGGLLEQVGLGVLAMLLWRRAVDADVHPVDAGVEDRVGAILVHRAEVAGGRDPQAAPLGFAHVVDVARVQDRLAGAADRQPADAVLDALVDARTRQLVSDQIARLLQRRIEAHHALVVADVGDADLDVLRPLDEVI